MAKHRDEQHTNGLDAFQLVEGEYAIIESHIGSMRIKDANGSMVNVTKEQLQQTKTMALKNGGTRDVTAWRFARERRLPFPKGVNKDGDIVSTPSTVDELAQVIANFADALTQYDAAPAFAMPDGRSKEKSFKLLVDNKGNSISAVAYIFGCLIREHKLNNQKTMYSANYDRAEKVMRDELVIVEPEKKIRARKANEPEFEDTMDNVDN